MKNGYLPNDDDIREVCFMAALIIGIPCGAAGFYLGWAFRGWLT